MTEPLPILYQDDQYVAIHKPSGLLVHRTRLDRGARRFALQMVRNQVGRHVFPVHRLDKGTSGVLLFGLSSEAAHALAEAFAAHHIEKTYLAVVRGHPPEAGTIDHPLTPMKDRLADAQDDKPAQEAVTHFARLATTTLPVALSRYPTSRYALVRLRPVTGRRHQLRRHLNYLSHPIIGDGKHGDYRHNRYFRDHLGCPRLLLAATRVRFTHPFTDAPVEVHAPLDASFTEVLPTLGWASSLADA
ncbi:MAG: pseudouridine synthase [Bacteroidota bacterium]